MGYLKYAGGVRGVEILRKFVNERGFEIRALPLQN